MAHLQPFGFSAYAKVPEEVQLKLDLQSVKYTLIGYAGMGGYRLLNHATRTRVISHDMIFDEGTRHRVLTVIEESDDLLAMDMPASNSSALPGLITLCQSTALHIYNGTPLYPTPHNAQAPGNTTGPTADPSTDPATGSDLSGLVMVTGQPEVAALVTTLPALQHSAQVQAQAPPETPRLYLANNAYAFMIFISQNEEDNKSYIPKTYAEAMCCPDLWTLAIQEELKVMEEL